MHEAASTQVCDTTRATVDRDTVDDSAHAHRAGLASDVTEAYQDDWAILAP